jgi:acetolactate synthase I/II/III large subunit
MLARSYGAYAERVESTAGFAEAWHRATGSGTTAAIELRLDKDQLNSRVSARELRSGRTARE